MIIREIESNDYNGLMALYLHQRKALCASMRKTAISAAKKQAI